MKKIQFACLFAVLACVVSLSLPAQAQIFASPAGTGTNCSASAPCSLPQAMSVVNGGNTRTVRCIDGGVGNVAATIQISVVIDCPGAQLQSGSGAAVFTITGPNTQVVILRNLTFEDVPNGTGPFIQVTGGATVIIENCRFDNMAHTNAIAVQFAPNSPAAQLIIRDSVFANNGIAPSSGGGLQVAPAAGGTASVRLERVSFDFNVTSMVLSGPVNATMIGSVVQASRSNGILVGSGATLDIKDSTLIYNAGSAVSVAAGGVVRLSNNDIKSNQIGISNSGGHALSYMSNRITGNGTTAALASIQGGQ
jgi:hypothetical protein